MINYQLGLLIAMFSFTYTNILTDGGQLLNGLYIWLNGVFKTDERSAVGLGPHWLFKIIIHCEKCNAGQIALWSYLFINKIGYILTPTSVFFYHVLFITYTILITELIKQTHKQLAK